MAIYSCRPIGWMALLLVGIVAAVQPFGSPLAAAEACTDTAASRADAAVLARACNRRVEAVDARTGTDQVFALPDGTWRLERRARPVRVQRAGGAWVPVDTSLRFAPDGSVVPGATSVGLMFSGGGTVPLVQLTSGDRRLDVGSPFGALPRPVLEGNTATYQDVLPGVDLRLAADVEGYTELLVVRTRAAAANPALRRISFPFSGPGLRTTVDAAGNVRVVDEAGAIVFGGEPPSMWDSRPAAAEAHAHADAHAHAHAPGGRHGPRMPTEVTQEPGRPASLVSITPSQEYLQHPETVYPVLIDPPLTRYKLNWTYVSADCGTCTFWNSSSAAQTGPIQGHTHMSYFQMSMADLQWRTNIVSGTFITDLLQVESNYWKETELWEVTPISSSTSWNNRPGKNANLGMVVLNAPVNGVAWTVTERLKYAAGQGWPNWTLGMFSLNDSDWAYGKWWSNNPALVVIYNDPPNTPSVQPFTECRAQCTSPAFVRTQTPTFRATVSDPNGGQVRADFEVRSAPSDSAALLGSATTGPVSSGQTATWTIGSGVLSDSTYYWRVRSKDELTWLSGWTGWQTVTIDTSPPTALSVSSVEYPGDQWGAVVGTSGRFTFSHTPADVAAFQWEVFGQTGTNEVPASTYCAGGTCSSTATIQFTPTVDLGQTMVVHAVDPAGNTGFYYYYYQVRPLPNRCWRWLLDETSGDTAPDTGNSDPNDQLCGPIGQSVSPQHGNLLGGVSWAAEPGAAPRDRFARFDGVSGEIYASNVLDASKSFTVMAWVRPSNLSASNGYQTLISQPGWAVDRFALRYSKDANGGTGGWCFEMHASDAAGTATAACATGTVGDSVRPQVGQWVHLAGVYNAASGQIQIHVMGNQESCNGEMVAAPGSGPWAGQYYFEIGLSYAGFSNGEAFAGDIDQVYAFQRPLFTSEICQQAGER